MASTADPPVVRALTTPAATALADLAAMFDDLQTVLRCCERLMTELAAPQDESNDLVCEALWTTAVLSYARCFAPGRRGMGLTEEDVGKVELQGAVVDWHKVLRQLRKHYADPAENPRERFAVGIAQGDDGRAAGIAITSHRQPRLDDVTVRQTGALAYELSKLVDKRITEHQEKVRGTTDALSVDDLEKLPTMDLTTVDAEPPAEEPSPN